MKKGEQKEGEEEDRTSWVEEDKDGDDYTEGEES